MWGWRVITAKWRGVYMWETSAKKRQVNMMQGHAKMAYRATAHGITLTRKNYHIKVNENAIIICRSITRNIFIMSV